MNLWEQLWEHVRKNRQRSELPRIAPDLWERTLANYRALNMAENQIKDLRSAIEYLASVVEAQDERINELEARQ